MRTIKATANLTPKNIYDLTKNPRAKSLKSAKGCELAIAVWMIYEAEDAKGAPVRLLAVRTCDGELYRTNSAVFIREFDDLTDIFPDVSPLRVAVEALESKAGREFFTAVYCGE